MIIDGPVIEIIVPRNLINLMCNTSPTYKESDSRLDEILKIIYQASPSQFIIRNRSKNRRFKKAVTNWNKEHPDNQVDYQTIVQKAVSKSNYTHSFEGDKKSADAGKIFHEFEDIEFPPFFTGEEGTRLYIKFIEPEEAKDIDVVSLHWT